MKIMLSDLIREAQADLESGGDREVHSYGRDPKLVECRAFEARMAEIRASRSEPKPEVTP